MAYATPLFEEEKATAPLLKLLDLTDLGLVQDGSMKSVLAATQTGWRLPTQHSGDITDIFAHLLPQAEPIFKELGFVGEQTGTRLPKYDYAVVMGAYILAVRKRFALLKRMWDEGLRFTHLVLCGGKRARHPVKESVEVLNAAEGGLTLAKYWHPVELGREPETEQLIMQMVLHQSNLPAEWSAPANYTMVDTPLRTDRPGKPDPSGEDALRWWLTAKQPKAGSSVVLVYSQPQLRHMDLVAKKVLGAMDMHVDCVGYEAPGKINVSQVLDTIAKVIFELAQ